MRRTFETALVLACLALAACSRGDKAGTVADNWGVIETYCYDCHNSDDRAGDLALQELKPEDVGTQAAIWEKALRKLRGNLMPPPGKPQPDAKERGHLIAALEQRLDAQADAAGPRPGYVGLHRLNRTEYANAVRDLLGVDIDATALLPRDQTKDGYDKVAEVLTISPTFLEQYVAAARKVSLEAVGDPDAAPGSTTYAPEGRGRNSRHVEGLPLGTRGGLAVTHTFPADGEYRINIADMAGALWVTNMEFKNTVLVLLDGREVYRTTIGGEEDQKAIDQNGVSAADRINLRLKNITFDATAGQHEVAVTFLARTLAESDARLAGRGGGGQDRILNIGSFEIQGPFNVTGVSDSPARHKIFACHPASGATAAEAESCAKKTVARLARRAYRRPVGDGELADLMAIYEHGFESSGFDAGVRRAIAAMLASPDFLYRFISPVDGVPGSVHDLDDFELATRLSFFIWSSIPDDELLDAAEAGRLSQPDVLESEVRRMLADARANSLVDDFAFQWLDIGRLDDVDPDRSFGADPRDAYRRELSLFMRSVLLEDHSVMDLLTADYTYVNESLANVYGIEGIQGDQFRRVTLTDPARYGLLGKGAVLMATSYPNRTAPVLRGKFVLENFMGSPPSPPPPNVNTDIVNDTSGKPTTLRERLAEHRTNPVCASCHDVMDPIGLTLENFNAIGAWRDREAGASVDASATLASGQEVDGPNALRQVLVDNPERFARTLTEELMIYALGRSLEYYDMPAVRHIVDDAAKDDYRFSSLILGIVDSDAFRKFQVPPADETLTADASGPAG